ncbi:unnamed protein product, partial [Rotaria sp. Silwood1]
KSSSWTIEDFEIGYLLGRGRFDYVYCGREKQTCFIVAYKILFKAPFKNSKMLQQVKREIEIQSSLKLLVNHHLIVNTQRETIRMIRSIELTFPIRTSSDFRDLIMKLLRGNSTDRLPLKDVAKYTSINLYHVSEVNDEQQTSCAEPV